MGFIEGEVGMVKYKGVFDLTGLLRMIRHYLVVERRYTFYERVHKAKIPKLELEWHAERKTTGYYRYNIDLKFTFYDMKEVEVDIGGEKKKMIDGRFWLKFDGNVEEDFTGSWEADQKSIRAKMKTFYDKVVLKKEFLVKHALPLIGEVTELRDRIYAYLGMVAGEEEDVYFEE